MTEKVLPYDRSIVPQETGYFCGPASTQIVLNSLGIKVTEQDMARELRTHTGGTDWIGQFPAVLNKYTSAGYFHVEMPKDPATSEQKERLWRDLVASIDGGRGVIANIVAPRSNYPRGVKGSVSPYYAGGTIYHYISVMGYDDAGARAVWIADSGFQPQGYWMSFDQLASLIPPKGYAAAPGPVAPAEKPAAGLSVETLSKAMGGTLPIERYRELLPGFVNAMVAADCTTVERAAMWCAQIGHESAGLRYMEEIASGAAYNGRADLGNTQPGDGPRYKGSGPIQLTGRHNFRKFSEWCHSKGWVDSPRFFEDNPGLVRSDPRWGFLAATWYWTVARPQINELSDQRDLVGVTRAINGGTNGLADRELRYKRCLDLGAALIPFTGGGLVAEVVSDGLGQLRPHENRLRPINRPENVNPSTRTPAEPWPYDMVADVWNESVWDGFTIPAAAADVPDDVGRSLVALVQTVASRQVRIESKIDRLLGGEINE